jgi:nucleotide-binding universal stress UspA family protein
MTEPGYRHVLVPLDGSEFADGALRTARALAERFAADLQTVAEPTPPPVRSDATWSRHHGPDEDADAYIERLGEHWRHAASEVDTHVVYDAIGPAEGLDPYLVDNPAGLVAVTDQ